MSKFKVRFVCNYLSDELLLKLLLNQNQFSDDFCFEPVLSNDFDYLVIFNHSKKKFLPSKSIAFIQEPSWSSHVRPKYLDKWTSIVFFHDKNLLNLRSSIIVEQRSYLPYYSSVSLSQILNTTLQKNRKMSFILSGLSGSYNYGFRQHLLSEILKTDLPIDIYGRDLNIFDKRYKGQLTDKFDGLRDYQYSIAIENTCERNYVTEKFIDCILNLTVPIYLGAPNIQELFLPNSFINLNVKEPIKQLSEILMTSQYKNHLHSLCIARNHLVSKDNIFFVLHSWLEKHGEKIKSSKFKYLLAKIFSKIYF